MSHIERFVSSAKRLSEKSCQDRRTINDHNTVMEFHQVLKLAMERERLSAPQVAKRMGVSRQTVYKWLQGQMPSRAHATGLAKLLGIENFGVANVIPLRQIGKRVPIIDQANAGRGTDAVNPYALGAAEDYLDVSFDVSEGTVALRLCGDSMEPDFHEGEIVIIDPAVLPELDDYVVAEVLETGQDIGQGRWTFKQYRPRGVTVNGSTAFDLVPRNPSYETISVNPKNPGRIIGTMVEHRRRRFR